MRGLEDIYREVVRLRREKFLGFFETEGLRFLEELLKTDLGIRGRVVKGAEPRKCRPFVGWFDGDTLNICFLTREKKTFQVELSKCKKDKRKCAWIKEHSYVLFDYRRGNYFVYSVKGLEPDYIFCGRCEDLEFLENLGVYKI